MLLSTILRERGYKVKAFIEDLAAPDWSFIESSDIVCISTITSTAIRAYKMGEHLRAQRVAVIMGGAHPTFLPDEALEYADFVIRGEGEHSLEDIISCIRTVRYHGIHIHGMFVLGAETDDVETIHETVDFAKGLGMETVQIMILTPLPGTPLFDDMMRSGRLLHTDWSKYDVQHVVFKPRLLSPATLQIETLRAMARFYSWKYIFRHLARLNFRYTAVGIFGKRAVRKSLKAFSA